MARRSRNHGRAPVSILGNEHEFAAVRHLIAPWPGQATSDADTDLITKDYIEDGIAALEDMLAAHAEAESLSFA